jgi:hypothetical protein
MELICSRPDLLQWLGAVVPESHDAHKAMRERGDIVVRCTEGPTMFWPWVADKIKARPK